MQEEFERVLEEVTGMSLMEILEEGTSDSICWAICTRCKYVDQLEPDAEKVTCPECGEKALSSALIIEGLI